MPDFAVPPTLLDERVPLPSALWANMFTSSYGYVVRRPQGTRDWLIMYTFGGKGFHRIGEQTIYCQTGDVTLLQPDSPHHYGTANRDIPWQFLWAHFIPKLYWIPWLELPNLATGLGFYTICEEDIRFKVKLAMQRMVEECIQNGPFQNELSQNALEEALLLIQREITSQIPISSDLRVDTVQKYLEKHYNQTHPLQSLADMVCLSPWRLSHIFKEKTGHTISEYLVRLRLSQAARFLELTSRKVEEVAKDVGFESPYHFSRLFKRHYGISPLTFRKMSKSRQEAETKPV